MSAEVEWQDFSMLTMAHELKAPLSLMRQLTLSLDFASSTQEQEKIKRQILNLSDQSLSQVDDLLKALRLEDALFEMEPINPRVVCDQVLSALPKSFQLSYRNQNKLIIAHPQLLYSVIYNFCVNALHYSDEKPCKISIQDYQKGNLVRIAVRDFGPSVPTPIWREIRHGKLKSPLRIGLRPGSSGIGLFIASRFTEKMHGDFGLIRHHNGTSFFIDLPVSKQMSLL